MKKINGFLFKKEAISPWIGLLISSLSVLLIQVLVDFQPFDDAYITYRYARNLSHGLGFVYNQGEKVLGTTTPLFTLLLAAIGYLTRPAYIPLASYALSVIADIISVWLIFRLTDSIFKSKWIAILSSAVFLLQPFRLNVASGGMETSLFITSLLLTYYSYLVKKRSYSTAIWAGLAALIRPDAVLALLPVYGDWLFKDWRTCLKAGLLTLLVVSPWLIWSTAYFGLPIPHSLLAKSITYKNPPGHAAFFLLTFLGTGTQGPYSSPWVLLPILLFGVPVLTLGMIVLSRQKSSGWILGAYPALYTLVMALINPAMIFSWYFLPLIPGMVVLTMGLIWFGAKLERKTRLLLLSVISLFLILVPGVLLHQSPSSLVSRTREASFWEACEQIVDHELVGKTVLAPDIGVIGWCLEEARILDPIGLVSPESLPYAEDLPPGQLVSLALIRDKEPDYIITLDHFLTPEILEGVEFPKPYHLLYQEALMIAGDTHFIYVFQLEN